jgi:hypothetical protein
MRLASTTRVVETPCPQCGAGLDAASTEEGVPRAGDISICAYCATPLKFVDDAGRVARLKAAEIAALPSDARQTLLHLMDVVRRVRRELKGRRP